MKDALIIQNPNSGKGISKEIINSFQKRLEELNIKSKLVLTKGPHHATEITKLEKHYDVLFSLGGDGTLNEVVNGNFKRKDPMTICPLPVGSCNDVSKMLGYENDLLNNLELAINGNERQIDIGTINDRVFTYVVGMGKFMHIPYATPDKLKKRIGYLAYLKEGVKEFLSNTKTYRTVITLDGKKISGDYSLILISNSNHIAGISNVYKDIKIDDEKFEVLLCKAKNKASLVNSFVDFYMGNKPKQIETYQAKEIDVILKEKPKHNWCIDGEKLNENIYCYHIKAGNKMAFLVPQDTNNKIFEKRI